MYFNITLAELHIDQKYRIYSFGIGVAETNDDGFPSLLLIAFVDGKWHLDLLYLKRPLMWLLRKAMGLTL